MRAVGGEKKNPPFSYSFHAAPSALLHFNMLEIYQRATSEINIINFDYKEVNFISTAFNDNDDLGSPLHIHTYAPTYIYTYVCFPSSKIILSSKLLKHKLEAKNFHSF